MSWAVGFIDCNGVISYVQKISVDDDSNSQFTANGTDLLRRILRIYNVHQSEERNKVCIQLQVVGPVGHDVHSPYLSVILLATFKHLEFSTNVMQCYEVSKSAELTVTKLLSSKYNNYWSRVQWHFTGICKRGYVNTKTKYTTVC